MKNKNYLFFIKYFAIYSLVIIIFAGGLTLINFLSKKFNWQFLILSIIFIYLLNVVFSLFIFGKQRQYQAKLSWLIVTIILPFLGHFIFLIFGLRYYDRNDFKEVIKDLTYELENNNHLKTETNDEHLKSQSNFTKRNVYNGKFDIFSNCQEGFNVLFQDLLKAKKSIYLEYYIIKPGEIWDQLKSILIQKSQEGVEIKMFIDDFGNWSLPWYEIENLKEHKIEISIFGKVRFPFIGSNNGFRLHKKLVIIDNKIVHTGGTNIGDEYVGLNKKYGLWIDYQAKITGPIVYSYYLLFVKDWNDNIEKNKISIKNDFIKDLQLDSSLYNGQGTIVEDGPNIKESILEYSILNWIYNAKKSIKITSPYFVPNEEMFEALKTASLKGVKVTIFIPGRSDNKKIVHKSTKFWSSELAKYNVEIRELNNMLIHSKIGVFDDEYAYLSTFNLDYRSIYSQFEFATLINGPIVEKINQVFEEYEKMSKKVLPVYSNSNKFIKKFIRGFLTFFAPIM